MTREGHDLKSKTAARLRDQERDYALDLMSNVWPVEQQLAGWNLSTDSKTLTRRHVVSEDEGGNDRYIWEEMLRFPTAALYGVDREWRNNASINAKNGNVHSMRLLANGPELPKVIERIYLLHNGLNETNNLSFYYNLVDMIDDDKGVYLLRPLPGHLTRMPFHGPFATKPLDRYLRDAGELFRQFLRFMIESQWLLSILAPREAYLVASGATLLSPGDKHPGYGRSDGTVLAGSIRASHDALLQASRLRLSDSERPGPDLDPRVLEAIVEVIRTRTGVESVKTATTPPDVIERPSIHVVGYSLGGSFAQSVFFSWPFLVTSCTSLFSGGPLKDVALTSFSHSEEWQSVLHALRYELDWALQDPLRYGRETGGDEQSVAGVDESLFEFFRRVFYEVFQQNFAGPFQSRLSEYSERLLFVVGGHDPIVTPKNVQESAPAEGLNLIEVAQLTHFVSGSGRDEDEERQRSFWLPQVAHVIREFAVHTETLHLQALSQRWLDAEYKMPAVQQVDRPRGEGEHAVVGLRGGPLPSPMFERVLDDAVDLAKRPKGYLVMARSDVPVLFLPPEEIRRRGSLLHHADDRVIRYLLGVNKRREDLATASDQGRVAVFLPQGWEELLTEDCKGHAANSETPGGQLSRDMSVSRIREFAKQSLEAGPLWVVPTKRVEKGEAGSAIAKLVEAVKRPPYNLSGLPWITGLPNVWFYFSDEAASRIVRVRESPIKLEGVLAGLPSFATSLISQREELKERKRSDPVGLAKELSDVEWLTRDGHLRLVLVSKAAYNPRYRGRVLSEPRAVIDALCHLAFAYSVRIPASPEAARMDSGATK